MLKLGPDEIVFLMGILLEIKQIVIIETRIHRPKRQHIARLEGLP